jgi:hypothetical protein
MTKTIPKGVKLESTRKSWKQNEMHGYASLFFVRDETNKKTRLNAVNAEDEI